MPTDNDSRSEVKIVTDGDAPSPGRLFREAFLDKNLVTFEECSTHYESMTPDELMNEMAFLFSSQVRAVPFGFSSGRYNAFLVSLIDCAASRRELDNRQRSKLVNIAIDIREYLHNRTAEDKRDALDKAFGATVERVKKFSLYPIVGDLVANNTRDYKGEFKINPVGEILEKRNGNFVIPDREVPEKFGFEISPPEENALSVTATGDSHIEQNSARAVCDEGPAVRENLNVPDDAEEFLRIEKEWRETLRKGGGDTPALIDELMPAIRAEAIRRKNTAWDFEMLISDAANLIDDIETWLDMPEFEHGQSSGKPRSKYDRFGKLKCIWRVWRDDAIENGAAHWRVEGGWRLPVNVDDLEGSLRKYVARPWLAHPLLDWALLGGWLLGSAHQWRENLNGRLVNELTTIWDERELSHVLHQKSDSMMPLLDAPETEDKLRHYDVPFNWKHALLCVIIATTCLYFWPTWWPAIVSAVVAWLILDRWISVRWIGTKLTKTADVIKRERPPLRAIKAAWIATNSQAIDLDDLMEKIRRAENCGLQLTPGFRALLALVRERHGRVLRIVSPFPHP